MKGQETAQGLNEHDDWHRAARPRDLPRYAPVMALSTAGGCAVTTACLWPLLPEGVWPVWLSLGLLLALAQWQTQRAIAAPSAHGRTVSQRRWIIAHALGAGVFWGASSFLLFPWSSIEHQLLLAFILVAVLSLWLPLFTLVRASLFMFAVPGLLPMAIGLLLAPHPLQTTMGSLLLIFVGAFAAAAEIASRIFFADLAARRALYHQATHDSLVGLANRAEFYRRARTLEIMGEKAYSIICIDLDHFKAVNDSAGHAVGDELLRQVGAVLRGSVRKGDTAARLGGDEFAILMSDCGAHEAAEVAATVRERIQHFVLDSRTKRVRVTASFGIASSADLCATPGRLLDAADHACYLAKRNGRNRVEIAARLAEPSTRQARRPELMLMTSDSHPRSGVAMR
jgi:diguanylate cyclase (GGDEF)-like protein